MCTCSAHLVHTLSEAIQGIDPSMHAQLCHLRQMRLRCNNQAHHTASFSSVDPTYSHMLQWNCISEDLETPLLVWWGL